METGPPALIEAIVGRLIPPAAREHVLGDLRERAADAREYVADAIRVIPLVILSQVRRHTDRVLLASQAYTLFLVFRPQRFAHGVDEIVWLALPIAVALAVLAVLDLYAAHDPPPESRPAPAPPPARDGAVDGLGYVTWFASRVAHIWRDDAMFDRALMRAISSAAVAMAATAWMLPEGRRLDGALGGIVMLTPLRIAWEMLFRANGYRRLAMHAIHVPEADRQAWRHALEQRRDLLRKGWVWYPAPFILAGYISLLFRPSTRAWVVIVEAAVTAAALLLVRALANRMAERLQDDIDDLAP